MTRGKCPLPTHCGHSVADTKWAYKSGQSQMSLFDENANVLRDMEGRGVDLGAARVVDFSHIFPDAESASSFIEACEAAGFKATDTTDDEMEQHDVTVSKEMTPTCEHITMTEQTLGEIAEQHGGSSDGWGFFSD